MAQQVKRYLAGWVEDPAGMGAYYRQVLVGATVCRVIGHRQDRVARMLGTCNRCWGHLPTDYSRAIWRAALGEEGGDRG